MMKKIAIILGVLIGLLLILALLLPRILDPNRYKDQIAGAVKNSTGRDLKILGDLSVSLVPLRIRLPEMELSNAPGFGDEPMAKIRSASIRAQLKPLLQGNLVVDSVALEGVSLNLAQDQSGTNNWGSMLAPSSGETPAKKEDKEGAIKSFELGSLKLQGAELLFRNEATGSSYAFRNLNLETGRIAAGEPFDFSLGADVEYDSRKSRIDLKARILLADNGFQLQQLDTRLDDSHLTGAAEAHDPSRPVWKFDFTLDQFDLDRYLSTAKQTESAPEEESPQTTSTAGVNGDGSIRIGKFKAFGMQLSDIALEIHARDGELRIGPNAAKLYGGEYGGNTLVGPAGKSRTLQLDEKLTGIQIAPLLKDAAGITRYTGSGSIHVRLQGNTGGDLLKTMKGTIDTNLKDGKIEGFDLLKIVNQATALAGAISEKEGRKDKLMAIKAEPGDQTLFTTMGATLALAGGVARTENIHMEGSALNATGGGSADLRRQTVDYKLQVTVKDSSGKALTVPVYVSGTFSDPKFGVDTGALIKKAATDAAKKGIQKGLDKLLKKKPPNR